MAQKDETVPRAQILGAWRCLQFHYNLRDMPERDR